MDFDRQQWASGKGNASGDNPRLSMVGDAREAGVAIGASRGDVRGLLGEPDSTGPEADVWYLGRDDMSVDYRMLRVTYDEAGRVSAVRQDST